MFRILSTFLLTCLAVAPVSAEWAHIQAAGDASLIEDAEGDAANGSGPSFRAGRTNQKLFGVRRALVRFDVAGELPEDAIIDRVFLTLYENSSNLVSNDVSLHRVKSAWGEGSSFTEGGKGAPAVEGDTTWLHTFWEYDYWVHQGGDFAERASAVASVDGNGPQTWQSTNQLVNDVRRWLHNPAHNFGWLVMGDEDSPQTAKRFASRESDNSSQHPELSVEYHLPGE